MNIFVYTLGCRVNQCESEAVLQAFAYNGHNILKSATGADLIIVNTCTVTSKAEQKARRVIRLYQEICPTVVTGCYAQLNAQEIRNLGKNVKVLPLSRKQDLLKLPVFLKEHVSYTLDQALDIFCSEKIIGTGPFDYAATGFAYHCRSYLKVQDGCDNECAYCRVHVARGKSSSLDAETAVKRALEIEKNGYHEIVLTGVNLTMYDHEKDGLGGLLEKMLEALGPDIRLRLSSLEPDHIDDRLLNALKDPRMQPYFHIPIQSASDKVLNRVNRKYSASHLESVVGTIREIKDDPFLACDIITGLPSEEDCDFEITKSFLKQYGFAFFHVFPFSPRPDTPLFKAKDRVPEYVRDQRAAELRQLAFEQNRDYIERQIGKNNEVILEEKKNGKWFGLTGNYIRTEVVNVPENAMCGDLIKVRLTEADRSIVL